MWQKILQFSKELLALKRQTEANTSEIKEIRQDIRDLTEAVRQLANAIQQDRTKLTNTRIELDLIFFKLLELMYIVKPQYHPVSAHESNS